MSFSLVARGVAALVLLTLLALLPGLPGGPTGAGAAPPPRPGAGCGGGVAAVQSTDGTWTCRFFDEFSGKSVDTAKWMVQRTWATGWHSGAECYVDDRDNVRVSGGTLQLTARKEAAPFTCSMPDGSDYQTQVTSGMVTTYNRLHQTYGRWEIRAKFPDVTTPGVHSALWMFPRYSAYGAWPASGEIDIAEFYSSVPDRAIPYVHYASDGTDPNMTSWSCFIDRTQFHTYRLDWTRTTITISIDGKVCLRNSWSPAAPLTKPAPFDQPFFLALTQALGIGQNAYSAQGTALPATTQVDWVRVWG
ncbi:family 16 glycosylhydrolase [Nocardioides caeni]|uniref:Glycoside hydrolase family 16 protein n=1 Tax=Nocardioides caeni TaxID=574700 RepID=A0A4V6T5V3_9ACTN|nr:glycoside hydrolase family 16 protein [Nocardioides caeni]THV11206.1 glycoside hydrolase family 16 protein [Nocardioides caeni]